MPSVLTSPGISTVSRTIGVFVILLAWIHISTIQEYKTNKPNMKNVYIYVGFTILAVGFESIIIWLSHTYWDPVLTSGPASWIEKSISLHNDFKAVTYTVSVIYLVITALLIAVSLVLSRKINRFASLFMLELLFLFSSGVLVFIAHSLPKA